MHPCWQWTTCEDSVAQVVALVAELEANLAIDRRRRFASGFSNGAVFLYELAADPRTAHLFAGYISISGSPHKGFNRPPLQTPAPLFGIWGRIDKAVPPFARPASDEGGDGVYSLDYIWGGWYYNTALSVALLWSESNNCKRESESSHSLSGPQCSPDQLGCVGVSAVDAECHVWRQCEASSEVILCIHPGDHVFPKWAPFAVRRFISRHTLTGLAPPPSLPKPLAPSLFPPPSRPSDVFLSASPKLPPIHSSNASSPSPSQSIRLGPSASPSSDILVWTNSSFQDDEYRPLLPTSNAVPPSSTATLPPQTSSVDLDALNSSIITASAKPPLSSRVRLLRTLPCVKGFPVTGRWPTSPS